MTSAPETQIGVGRDPRVVSYRGAVSSSATPSGSLNGNTAMPNGGRSVMSLCSTPRSSNACTAASISARQPREAQMVKAAAKRVEAVAGPFGIHRTQPQGQVTVDHDDAVLQQVDGQVVVGVVSRRRGVHGDLEPQQLGVERPGPLDVGDGEPQVVAGPRDSGTAFAVRLLASSEVGNS
jgi:hypothetical protein